MTTVIANIEVNVNEEGYLTDLNQWTKEIALEIAEKEGVTMQDKNWEVISWIQDQYRNEISLSTAA